MKQTNWNKIKVSNIMKVSTTISEPPPWHEDGFSIFYIQGFGFVFEADVKDVLKAEYNINLTLQKTKYLTMEDVLFGFGLPTALIEGKDYYWDFRSDEDIFTTIDFHHEKMNVDFMGDQMECIVISFRQVPEKRE